MIRRILGIIFLSVVLCQVLHAQDTRKLVLKTQDLSSTRGLLARDGANYGMLKLFSSTYPTTNSALTSQTLWIGGNKRIDSIGQGFFKETTIIESATNAVLKLDSATHAGLEIDRGNNSSRTATVRFQTNGSTNFEMGLDNNAPVDAFIIGNSGQATRYLTIESGGNVGIGTSDPLLTLTSSNLNYAGLGVSGMELSGATHTAFAVEGGSSARLELIDRGATSGQQWLQIITDGGVSTLRALANNASVTSTFLTGINSSGFVGFGTTGPDRRVDILDASNPQARFTYTDGSVYTDVQTNSSGYFGILPSGSRVGINNSAPTTALDVTGGGYISQSLTVGGDIQFSGAGGTVKAFSDDVTIPAADSSNHNLTIPVYGGAPGVAQGVVTIYDSGSTKATSYTFVVAPDPSAGTATGSATIIKDTSSGAFDVSFDNAGNVLTVVVNLTGANVGSTTARVVGFCAQ